MNLTVKVPTPSRKLRKIIDKLSPYAYACAVVLNTFPNNRLTIAEVTDNLRQLNWKQTPSKRTADALKLLVEQGVAQRFHSPTKPRYQLAKDLRP